MLRAPRQAHQAKLSHDTTGNQIGTTSVTNVIGSDDELRSFGICRAIARMTAGVVAELEFLSFR